MTVPDKSAKFTGWREKSNWSVDSVDYQLEAGSLEILPSKVVGSTTNNNLLGSTTNVMNSVINF